MPHMQNVLGDLFGGHLMALVDQAAAVAAIRHAGGPAVTKSIDRLDFHHPIPVGALVTCYSTVDFVGNSSMDITVNVFSEQVSTGVRQHTHTAHVVFVAERLHRHDDSVHDGRPHDEPDEAQVRLRLARSVQQEDTDGDVEAHDHHEVLGLVRCAGMPRPPRRPHHGQRIKQESDEAEHGKSQLEKPVRSCHCAVQSFISFIRILHAPQFTPQAFTALRDATRV